MNSGHSAAAYFHGGKPGMRRGEFLLPPTITREPSCSEFGGASVHRRDRVYVATKIEAALIYAAMHQSGRGTIYECEPIGVLEPDPDCDTTGLSFAVERALIVKVALRINV